ncbi:MAG: D-alanine--D-alanine ligase A, partial [Actinomyces sp.]
MPDSPATQPTPSLESSRDAIRRDKRKPRVAVVFGGRSGEHTISCATAAGVLSAIDRDRYDVLPIGITPTGQWVLVDDDPAALALDDSRPPVRITADGLGRGELAVRLGGGALTALTPTGPNVLGDVDV